MLRRVASRVLFAGAIGIASCHQTQTYTSEELGCGAGAYAGQPAQYRLAQWPEPLLGFAQHAALHVAASDVATDRAAVPLNLWIIQGSDTLKSRTSPQGTSEFSTLVDGPAEVRAWFFNYVPTSDTIRVRTGYRDSLQLRLGRTGQECYIVPDSGRRAVRRPTSLPGVAADTANSGR